MIDNDESNDEESKLSNETYSIELSSSVNPDEVDHVDENMDALQ